MVRLEDFNGGVSKLNYELQDKLFRLNTLIHKWANKSRASKGVMGDVYRGQGRILEFLRIKDGISTRDLSYFLGLSISSLNELLAKLEKSELIVRVQSEEDKRVMLIHLTDAGRTAEGKQEEMDMFSDFSDEEQVILDDYLGRIISYLELDLGQSDEDDEVNRWQEDIIDRIGIGEFRRIMEMNRGCGQGRRRAESECCGGGHGKGHGHHEHGEECGCGEGHGKGHGHHEHGEDCCGGGHGKGHHRHDEYTHGGKYLGNQGNECGCEI